MIKFIVFLLLFLSTNALAKAPLLWGPNNTSLNLQSSLQLTETGPTLVSGTTDPTLVAVSGNRGSLYLNTSNGQLYVKQDNGLSTNWVNALTSSSGWSLLGNAGTNSAVNFLGTTDAQDLAIRTNNVERVRINSTGVGIDVAPSVKLDVNGGARLRNLVTAGPVLSDSSGNITVPADRLYTDKGGTGVITAGARRNVLMSDALNWTTSPVFSGISSTQVVHVDKSGSDVYGDGSPNNPYLTMAKAASVITDATSAKRYIIKVGPGTYGNVTLPDSVSLVGSGSNLTFVGNINFTASAVSSRTYIADIQTSVGSFLTTNTSGAAASGYNIILSDFIGDWNIIGGTNTNNNNIATKDCVLFDVNVTSGNFIAYHMRQLAGTLTIPDASTAYGYIFGSDIEGAISVTGRGQIYIFGSFFNGNLTLTTSGANSPVFEFDDISYPVGTLTYTGATLTRYTNSFATGYTPAVSGNWSPVPNNVKDALDQLATRGFGLTAASPVSVGSTNNVGVSTYAARADHVHQGVHSISTAANPQLYGDVVLTAGSNVTIGQLGNNVVITATATSSGGSNTAPLFSHSLFGGISYADPIDPPSVVNTNYSNLQVRVSAANSGLVSASSVRSTEVVIVKNYPGHSTWQTAAAHLSSNGGYNTVLHTLSPTMTATSGDTFRAVVTGTPLGFPEDLRVDFIFY